MRNIIIVTFFIFSSIRILGQSNETINEFVFSKISKNGRYQIIINSDSAFFEKTTSNPPSGTAKIKIKILKSDWDKLISSISEYKLVDLVNLSSPTDFRSADGASASTISITTNKSKYDCGTFDNYEPNEKLSRLMMTIQEIEKRSKE